MNESGYPIGARVRIAHVGDADGADLVGRIGTVTNVFPGLMWPGVHYACGLWMEDGKPVNLCPGDRLEPADADPTEAGAQACREGEPWWHNPHPAGSVAAYQWDTGHSRTRRAGGGSQGSAHG